MYGYRCLDGRKQDMEPIRSIDPQSPEYDRDYANGWRASENYTDGALERADARGVSHAWYDGYADSAAGRPKWTYREARRAGYDSVQEYWDRPER